MGRKRKLDLASRDERLWRERKFTDAVVICEGHRFPVHRAILYTASPVFERMLENGMRESELSDIEIKDASPEAVEAMLQHVYTAVVPEGASPAKLFALSMRFGLERLAKEVGNLMLEDIGRSLSSPKSRESARLTV